jgi:hypothetical protein
MSEENDTTTWSDENLLGKFESNYRKVLSELDVLYRGVYDPDEGAQTAALCLLTIAPLIKIQAAAELKARALKRDIDFEKAKLYSQLIEESKGGKKPADATLQQLVAKSPDIHNLYQKQNEAEREAKELANILALLKDAHITFRSVAKKGE